MHTYLFYIMYMCICFISINQLGIAIFKQCFLPPKNKLGRNRAILYGWKGVDESITEYSRAYELLILLQSRFSPRYGSKMILITLVDNHWDLDWGKAFFGPLRSHSSYYDSWEPFQGSSTHTRAGSSSQWLQWSIAQPPRNFSVRVHKISTSLHAI